MSLNYLTDLYLTSFYSLSGEDRVRIEKKMISLLRFIHGYEKDRFDHIIACMKQTYQNHEQLFRSRTTLSGELARFFSLSSSSTGAPL